MQLLPPPIGFVQTGNVRAYIPGRRPGRDGTVEFTYWEHAAHDAWDRAQRD